MMLSLDNNIQNLTIGIRCLFIGIQIFPMSRDAVGLYPTMYLSIYLIRVLVYKAALFLFYQ